MLKKIITYTDFNGQQHTEDFYFNLSKAELAEWEMRENLSGGLGHKLEAVIKSGDGRLIMDIFKEIIAKSIGKRSADGRSFIKNEQITQEFLGSGAYEELFMELISDPDAAKNFINAVVPQNLDQVANEMLQRQKTSSATTQQQINVATGTPQQQFNLTGGAVKQWTVSEDPSERYRTPATPVEHYPNANAGVDQAPNDVSGDYHGGQHEHYPNTNTGYLSRPPHEGNN